MNSEAALVRAIYSKLLSGVGSYQLMGAGFPMEVLGLGSTACDLRVACNLREFPIVIRLSACNSLFHSGKGQISHGSG